MSGAVPSLPHIAAYGFLALPLAFAGLPLYIHMPDYYTREMGLGIAATGIILMALRFLDAIQDPLIGYISDKSATLQRMIMGLGIVTLLAGMGALLFGPPGLVPVAYWFAGAVALTALGLSMVGINLVMIGSLWSQNDAVRARASGVRESMSLAGMLLASVLPGVFMLSMSKADAFQYFYFIFAALLLAGAFAFVLFYRQLPAGHAVTARPAARISVKLPAKFFGRNKGFLSACFLTHMAASFPAVLFLYFVTDYLMAGDKAALFLLLYFLAGACFMPLWIKLAGIYSAERAWLVSMATAIAAFIWAFTLGEGDILAFGIICVLSGAALGADLALPPVMMARRLQIQNGESYAAQAYAILNLIPKIALALGTGCAFLLLDRVEFSPSQANTPAALAVLAALYALLPCAVKAISGFIVFNLHNGVLHDVQKRSIADGHANGA